MHLAQLQAVAGGFLGALLLALMSATLEGLINRRAHGLRRRRGGVLPTAIVATGVKLLAKAPAPHSLRRALAALAVLLPAILLAGGLPTGGGMGALAPTMSATSRFVGLAGLLATVPLALMMYALMLSPERRLPLVSVAIPLLGAQVAMVLCVAVVLLPPTHIDGSLWTRTLPMWPLWQHPAGALAVMGAQVVLARSLRIAIGGTGSGRLSPGLADGGGAGTVLLQLLRPMLIGASSAMAVHLYLGLGSGPTGLVWAGTAAWICLVAVLQVALTESDAPGLTRLLLHRILPLAGIDVAISLLQAAGVISWS